MWHWQQGFHQKDRLLAWIFCTFVGIGISIVLFAFMPALIEKEPKMPQLAEYIDSISVIRIKRTEPKITHHRREEIKRPKKKKLLMSKAIYISPEIGYKKQFNIPFKINPTLPPLDCDLNVQPVTTTGIDLSSFGIKGAFTIGEVDSPPVPIVQIPPIYPLSARMKGIEGWVVVRFIVDENGYVRHIQIVDSKPKGVFESAVIRCVSQWRFKPATLEGIKVKTLVQTKISFKLK